jgi:hypothetical protein
MSKKMNKRHSKINNIVTVENAAHNLGILQIDIILRMGYKKCGNWRNQPLNR